MSPAYVGCARGIASSCILVIPGAILRANRVTPVFQRPEQVLAFPTLYTQNCTACHGENGKNGAAIPLANPVYLALRRGEDRCVRSSPTAFPIPHAAFRKERRRHVDRAAGCFSDQWHGAQHGEAQDAPNWTKTLHSISPLNPAIRSEASKPSRLLRPVPRRRRGRLLVITHEQIRQWVPSSIHLISR